MKIYHYTDLHGLKGILENKCLWATNYAFLNDSQEMHHGINCINNALNHINGEISEELIASLKQAVQFFKEVKSQHAYNISFCLSPDLLSMWRGYGDSQKVCLEFDSDALFGACDSSDRVIYNRPVIYTEENSTTKALDEIIQFFKRESVMKDVESGGFNGLFQVITLAHLLPPFFKVRHFEEEQEYRFVIYANNKYEDVKLRVNDKGVTPYIELKMHELSVYGGRLPLNSIKIGPGQDTEEIKKGIEFMLNLYDFKNVDVTLSKVPYKS